MAVTTAFEEAALALGGVVATYQIPDDAIWDLARALDLIHGRACTKCGTTGVAAVEATDHTRHPAIIHLLAQLRRTSAATGRRCSIEGRVPEEG